MVSGKKHNFRLEKHPKASSNPSEQTVTDPYQPAIGQRAPLSRRHQPNHFEGRNCKMPKQVEWSCKICTDCARARQEPQRASAAKRLPPLLGGLLLEFFERHRVDVLRDPLHLVRDGWTLHTRTFHQIILQQNAQQVYRTR